MLLGITGCSGTGSTTVSKVWESLGAEVCSLDTTGHRFLAKKSVKRALETELSIDTLTELTGPEVRKRLSEVAFTDKAVLDGINSVLHPRLVKWVAGTARKLKNRTGVFVLDAALIFELGLEKYLDFVITVTDRRERVVERLVKRDGVSPETVAGRWKNQLPIEEKAVRSHFVICNSDTETVLKSKAEKFYTEVIQRMEDSSGPQNQKKAH